MLTRVIGKKIEIVINARVCTLAASVEFCNSECSLSIDLPAYVVLPAIYGVSFKTRTAVRPMFLLCLPSGGCCRL